MKKWWIFGADFFTVWCRFFFTVYADFSRFVRGINGEKENISLSMSFFTVSFHGLPPLEMGAPKRTRKKRKNESTKNQSKNQCTQNRILLCGPCDGMPGTLGNTSRIITGPSPILAGPHGIYSKAAWLPLRPTPFTLN